MAGKHPKLLTVYSSGNYRLDNGNNVSILAARGIGNLNFFDL